MRITRECVHLDTRGQFWSRDKDGGYTPFDLPYPKTPAARKLRGSMFYTTGVIAHRSAYVRLTRWPYEQDPYSLEIYWISKK